MLHFPTEAAPQFLYKLALFIDLSVCLSVCLSVIQSEMASSLVRHSVAKVPLAR